MKALGCRRPDPAKFAAHPLAVDHPAVRARLADHVAGVAPLPPSADKLPPRPRADQGRSGSCTWGSSSVAVYTALESLGTPLGFVPSQRVGYAVTRAWERGAEFRAGSLPALSDSGADVEDVFVVMSRYGVRPMLVEQTPDGRFYDIWTDVESPPGNVNDEPDLANLEVSGQTLVKLDVRAHTIAADDPSVSDLLAAALDASPALPVLASGFVDTAFENVAPGGVAGAPDKSDPTGGGHAYWFSAYRTNAAGEREFKLENSWGQWCDDGACWVALAFIRACWGFYVLDVSIQKVAA